MKLRVPEFQIRFMRDKGNLIYPGNVHPVGAQRSIDLMFERTVAAPADYPKPGGLWLIIGGSGGFGSAARVALASDFGADSISVSFHQPANPEHPDANKAIGSAAWHRDLALEKHMRAMGRTSVSLNLDAFNPDAIESVRTAMAATFPGRKIDGIVWSLAAPKGLDPRSGTYVSSALKPCGRSAVLKTFTERTSESISRVEEALIPAGTPEEAIGTQYVMGGRPIELWINRLLRHELLGEGATLLTVSYRGTRFNAPVYRDGLLGLAKADLEFYTRALDALMKRRVSGRAIAVQAPAVITEASAAIPGCAFYIGLLFDVMGSRYEDPLDSMRRLFREHFAPGRTPAVDENHLIRIDDREQSADLLNELQIRWDALAVGDAMDPGVYTKFMNAYAQTRGFNVPGVDYEAEFDTNEVAR
jgi:enoyl-[acyl-carrier protein] reductase/trans-2-enoyl-CoA reductase (NAD+)